MLGCTGAIIVLYSVLANGVKLLTVSNGVKSLTTPDCVGLITTSKPVGLLCEIGGLEYIVSIEGGGVLTSKRLIIILICKEVNLGDMIISSSVLAFLTDCVDRNRLSISPIK